MTLEAGTRLGPYEILSPLGAGGMGEVYRARDPKLNREVAIKVLPESLAADADALARFKREALAVASLSDPNILAIHDFGSEAGKTYAVMELLRGETLREKLDGGPIPLKQAVNYALQVAKGLSAAHENGIVHRDLKPANLFVTNKGHLKILDFGIAKKVDIETVRVGTGVSTSAGHTEPGMVLGTASYMSPEQVRGLPVDQRSDIFSFGSILYELLAGWNPFKRDSVAETLTAILNDEPQDMSVSARSIPTALDHIVRHCLEKKREDRFQSAKDVAFAISEALPPATGSGPQHAPADAGWRRFGVALAAVVVLGLAGVFFLRRSHAQTAPGAGSAKRIAVLPFENLGGSEDDYFADGIADAVRGKLTSVQGVEVIARGSSTPYKKTTKTPKRIADELGAHYLLTATVRWQKTDRVSRVQVTPELVEVRESGAPASRWQQPFDAALTDVFQVQSDIASRVTRELGVALQSGDEKRLSEKPTENLAAYDAFLKGEEAANGLLATDPPSLRKAVGFYDQAVALDPAFAQAWARVSGANSLLYANSLPSPALADRAKEAGEKAVALAPHRPEGYLAAGNYELLVTRDFHRALAQYDKGLRVAPDEAALLRGTAIAEQSLGHWDAAVERFRQAQRMDPRFASNLAALGDALLRLRRYSESREALDRGLALAPANLGLIELKAMTFLGEGDLAGARAVLRGAPKEVEPTALVAFLSVYLDLGWVLDEGQREILLRLTPTAFDDDRGVWALCLLQAYAWKGDAANVRSLSAEASKAFEAQVRDSPSDAQRHIVYGLALAYSGRKEDAIRESERGVTLAPISMDADQGPYYQHQLVRTYILVGEPEKALDRLEPLLKIPYSLSPGWLKIDPNFDPLRSNPRFQRLVGGVKTANRTNEGRAPVTLDAPSPAMRLSSTSLRN